MHRSMPPKSASTTAPNSAIPIDSRPPSSINTAVIPPLSATSSEPSHEIKSANPLQKPLHAPTPASQTQLQSRSQAHVQDEGSVKPGPGEGPSGNGKKKKVVKKIVKRVVKRVIKRRVPKGTLMNQVQGSSSAVKAEADLSQGNASVREPVIGEAGSDLSGINSVETEPLKLDGARVLREPIIGKKGSDLSGIYSANTGPSKLDFGTRVPEQMSLANDQGGIRTMDTEYMKSSNVIAKVDNKNLTVCAHDLMEVDNGNYAAVRVKETKETRNTVMKHQSGDSFVGNQNVDPVGGKSVVLDSDVENDGVRFNEELLLRGEMRAVERKKQRKTEIFVGGLDNDTEKNDITKAFEEAGMIVGVELIKNFKTGKNDSYAFVRFATAADASNALTNYSKVEICGKQCYAAPVTGNDTLFLRKIDRKWKAEDVEALLEKAGIRKIDKVTVKADPNNIGKNRGFAFVELETCKAAHFALNKLQKNDAFGIIPRVQVTWAEHLVEPDEEEILKVKTVYAEYLPPSWDRENVKEYFKRFGDIEYVVLAKELPSSRRLDYAFIHYKTRDAALTCIEAIRRERSEGDGSKVKMAVSLAKPLPKPNATRPKYAADQPIKQLPMSNQQYSNKLHERIQSSRRQRSNLQHILPPPVRPEAATINMASRPRTGIDAPNRHFPLPIKKRPFPFVEQNPPNVQRHNPRHVVPQQSSQVHRGSSYPISGSSSGSGSSSSFRGVAPLSSPYYHQPGPGSGSRSANASTNPSHHKTMQQAPHYGGTKRIP